MSESHSQNFNHLKIHTQYSICEGAARIDDLQEYSKKNKIKSLGLCDTSNLCGALEFAEKIAKSGTQPIIGTQINFKIGETIGLLPLFALNEAGYKNIIELSSFSYLKNDELSDPHVDFELLLSHSKGVAVFSGTVFGLFGKLFIALDAAPRPLPAVAFFASSSTALFIPMLNTSSGSFKFA